MKAVRIIACLALTTTIGVPVASAQTVRGFVAGGVTSDLNHQRFPTAAGGVLVNLGPPGIAVGAQGETFWLWPYFAGRGTVFAQGNLRLKGGIQPFVLGGIGFGESAGPMIGGGVELRLPNRRVGVRVSVEDYLSRISGVQCDSYGLQSYCEANPRAARGYVEHQLAVRLGVLF